MKVLLTYFLACAIAVASLAQVPIPGDGSADITLDPGQTYILSSTLQLASGVTLDGRGATIQVEDFEGHGILINAASGVTIRNVTMVGFQRDPEVAGATFGDVPRFLVYSPQAQGLDILNSTFRDHVFSALSLRDQTDLNVEGCQFLNIGMDVSQAAYPRYSFDAIFVGAYGSTRRVNIRDCFFRDIPATTRRYFLNDYKPDGDGVQVFEFVGGTVDSVAIEACAFHRMGRRGVKWQGGDRLTVRRCTFTDSGGGVGFIPPDDDYIHDVLIEDNDFSSLETAVWSNCAVDGAAEGVTFTNNRLVKCRHSIRTFGLGTFANSTFSQNTASGLERTFATVKGSNLTFRSNTCTGWANEGSPSYYMGFLIVSGSSDVAIERNVLDTREPRTTAVYAQANTANVTVANNTWRVGTTARGTDDIILDLAGGLTAAGNTTTLY